MTDRVDECLDRIRFGRATCDDADYLASHIERLEATAAAADRFASGISEALNPSPRPSCSCGKQSKKG